MKPDVNALLATISERLEAIQKVLADLAGSVSTTAEGDAETRQRNTETISEQVRLTNAAERKRSTEYKKNLCVQWVIGLGTWAAVMAASVYAGIAANQLTQMRRATHAAETAANIADQSMRVDQRAWMTVSVPTKSALVGSDTKPIPASIPITFDNIGKTPAVNIEMKIVVTIQKSDELPVFDYTPGHARYLISDKVWFPHSPDTQPFNATAHGPTGVITFIVRRPLLTDLLQGRKYLVAHGSIMYDDVFGIHHWVNFCRMQSEMEYGATKAQEVCRDYNEIDQNDQQRPN
jgi:hypothetical protein